MRVFLIDKDAGSREVLYSRVQEALRQAGFRQVQIVDGEFDILAENLGQETPRVAFLGPGCYQDLEESISRFRSLYPNVPLGVVLANEVYATEAVELRRIVSARIMPIADIAQMAQFILDFDSQIGPDAVLRNRGVITLLQFKGGVGTTTLAAALGACWARHDLKTVLVDLDDVSAHLSSWAEGGVGTRKAVADLLYKGAVPAYRVKEIVSPLKEYEGKLFIMGQPETYAQCFHFRADVLEDAPSSAEFIQSLIPALQEEFDVVLVDGGRSWGVAVLSLLPLSRQVLLVTDDREASVRQTLESFSRFCRESDDPAEFDLTKWGLVLNSHTERRLSPKDVKRMLSEVDLFFDTVGLYVVPYSQAGESWWTDGKSLYEIAEESVRMVIEDLAFGCVPFRRQRAVEEVGVWDSLRKKFGTLFG